MPAGPKPSRLYGSEWRKLRAALLASQGAVCRTCGATGTQLHLSHLSRGSQDRTNLGFFCASCQNRYFAAHRLALARRRRARRERQMWLLPEIERAAQPVWRWPAPSRQMSLF